VPQVIAAIIILIRLVFGIADLQTVRGVKQIEIFLELYNALRNVDSIVIVILIIAYLSNSFGLRNMAKKLKIRNSWVAWVPFFNVYLIGKIAGDQVVIFNKVLPKLGRTLLIGLLLVFIFSSIPFAGLIMIIAYSIVYLTALNKVYKIFDKEHAVTFIVLSIILEITASFFIFFASRHEPDLKIFNEGKPTDLV
jgi:hypothetical protein